MNNRDQEWLEMKNVEKNSEQEKDDHEDEDHEDEDHHEDEDDQCNVNFIVKPTSVVKTGKLSKTFCMIYLETKRC